MIGDREKQAQVAELSGCFSLLNFEFSCCSEPRRGRRDTAGDKNSTGGEVLPPSHDAEGRRRSRSSHRLRFRVFVQNTLRAAMILSDHGPYARSSSQETSIDLYQGRTRVGSLQMSVARRSRRVCDQTGGVDRLWLQPSRRRHYCP